VDLRELARVRRWRWHFEESYQAERDPATRGDGRWYVEVLCRRGMIYPARGDQLIAYTATRGVLRKLLALDAAVRVHQHGDTEGSVRFPVALLDAVAGVLRPRRRRTLAPERARAIGKGTAYGAHARSGGPGSVIGQPDGVEPAPRMIMARGPLEPSPLGDMTQGSAMTHGSHGPMEAGRAIQPKQPTPIRWNR
jgi:hypothetical protein